MDQLLQVLLAYGLIGLVIASFTESFISPVLPDLLLIPLALAAPDKAILYAVAATAASVAGGVIGYFLGGRYGVPLVKRIVPAQHIASIRRWVTAYGPWAIILAALAPIPYKFVSISAGVFRISFGVFLLASVVGRAKRFLLEGLLIYYYGPQAVDLIKKYSDDTVIVVCAVVIAMIVLIRRLRSAGAPTTPAK
ncbi:YqaA family protein [Sporolituus thermophilus]|uniref:Membrane protein YqaA, SNARE-associated domain n=1 Tax=Sporolituus thermophilus DSM 23256 TaxID=1123285 RepID=A0A1G7MGD5_9FIRM|nr:VTT domain-containing protein [Sporolituus thermophilus]SDF60882.1 membrane protein YqaA, SNARE-associated domain [Sporolituus thermophilus DSM 23256]